MSGRGFECGARRDAMLFASVSSLERWFVVLVLVCRSFWEGSDLKSTSALRLMMCVCGRRRRSYPRCPVSAFCLLHLRSISLQGDPYNRGDDPNEMGGNLGAADLGTNVTPIDLVTGMDYVCALTSAGRVKWCV